MAGDKIKQPIHSVYVCVLLLVLFPGCCLNLQCAHCRMSQYDEDCEHPLGFKPPFNDCGEESDIKCFATAIYINHVVNYENVIQYNMNFESMLFDGKYRKLTFRGCGSSDYCSKVKHKPFKLFGAVYLRCESCSEDYCNLDLFPLPPIITTTTTKTTTSYVNHFAPHLLVQLLLSVITQII